jgi:hypothetical protein
VEGDFAAVRRNVARGVGERVFGQLTEVRPEGVHVPDVEVAAAVAREEDAGAVGVPVGQRVEARVVGDVDLVAAVSIGLEDVEVAGAGAVEHEL